jgi:cytosine/adenosine deaminase-related metal-dependent hydrolase
MFPGFIDPHIHPATAAFYQMKNIRADEDWAYLD